MFKSGSELGRIGMGGGRLGGDDVIPRPKPAAPDSKRFTRLAPQPVAIAGAAHRAARDRKPQPRDRRGVRRRCDIMKSEKPIGDAGARGKHAPKLVTAQQTGAARKAVWPAP